EAGRLIDLAGAEETELRSWPEHHLTPPEAHAGLGSQWLDQSVEVVIATRSPLRDPGGMAGPGDVGLARSEAVQPAGPGLGGAGDAAMGLLAGAGNRVVVQRSEGGKVFEQVPVLEAASRLW